jgi:hypothetical protein
MAMVVDVDHRDAKYAIILKFMYVFHLLLVALMARFRFVINLMMGTAGCGVGPDDSRNDRLHVKTMGIGTP